MMEASKQPKWMFNIELPDIERIATLSVISLIAGIILAMSFVVTVMWSSEMSNRLDNPEVNILESPRDSILFIGGAFFGIAALLYAYTLIYTVDQLYNLTVKGGVVRAAKAAKLLYVSSLLGGVALLLFVIAMLYDGLVNIGNGLPFILLEVI